MTTVEGVDPVVDALRRHPGKLMSSKLCPSLSCGDPQQYYAPLVLGIEETLWKRHVRSALTRVVHTRIGNTNDLKAGTWFFVGDALPPCLVDARGNQCTRVEDADLHRSVSSDDARRPTKRPKSKSRKSQSGAEFRDDDEPMNVSAAPVPESGVVGEEGRSDEALAAAPRHGNQDTSPPPPPPGSPGRPRGCASRWAGTSTRLACPACWAVFQAPRALTRFCNSMCSLVRIKFNLYLSNEIPNGIPKTLIFSPVDSLASSFTPAGAGGRPPGSPLN
jgi:hypothetical protein